MDWAGGDPPKTWLETATVSTVQRNLRNQIPVMRGVLYNVTAVLCRDSKKIDMYSISQIVPEALGFKEC